MSSYTKNQRLASLDILRGFDLFLLVGLQPILFAIGSIWDNPTYHTILMQFEHEVWEGFRLWDIIMPLFLFMTGVTIPFSMDGKREVPKTIIYRSLLRRFFILWVLGMIMQGNLLGLDWKLFKLYSNTLQAIAVGYLFTSLIYMHTRVRTMLIISGLLLFIYAVPFLLTGNYAPQENFAIRVDQALLGLFMDAAYWDTTHTWVFSKNYNYTWIWSSLNFTVTVIMGCFAGKLIKEGHKTKPTKVCIQLLLIGLLCVGLGLLWSINMPIIKRIWTSSMTLFSGGICFILMGLFYYIIDIKKWSAPFRWLNVYGMNSIIAYFLGEFMNFRSVVHCFSYGLEDLFPQYKELILTSGNYILIFLILLLLYRNKLFLKI